MLSPKLASQQPPPSNEPDPAQESPGAELDPLHPDWTSPREDVFIRRGAGKHRIALVDPHSVIPMPRLRLFDRHAIVIYEMARRLAREHDVVAYPRRSFGDHRIDYHEDVTYRHVSVAADRALNGLMRLAAAGVRRQGHAQRPTDRFARYAARVAHDVSTRGCDIVHVCGANALIPVVRRLNPHARIVFHLADHSLAGIDAEVLEARLEHAALILGGSELATREMRTRFPALAARCHTLHNGVGLRFLQTPGFPAQSQTVLFVGRLAPEKGVHGLLEAFAHVAAARPQANLHLVGPVDTAPKPLIDALGQDDPLNQRNELLFQRPAVYLEALQARAGALGACVRFEGPVPNHEIAPHYARAGVFVYPSLWREPSGIAVLEAMAAGLPVVASRGGALPEIVVDGETGLLVERGNVHALAAAMVRLLENPELRARMGAAGRERVERFFTWGRSVARLNGLYDLAA
jgi:glycosyltransferase involved in cell wall biosynthesis